jgi:hypothetical protein
MSAATNDSTPTYDAYPLDLMSVVRLVIIGAVSGAIGWLLYLGVAHYFIEPVFCRNADTFSVCRNGGTIAWATAHVVVMAAAVAVLARIAVYRPLLVVLAALVTLWAAHAWLGGLEWYYGLLWQALLFGFAFALFGQIARMTNFLAALLISVGIAVLLRVVLMYT